MNTFPSVKIFLAFVILMLNWGCDDESVKKKNDSNKGTPRFGESLRSTSLRYYDAKPVISADGNKVAFISGRDGEYKVYKYDRTKAAAAIAERATSGEYGAERSVAISPDGRWLLFLGVKDLRADLYLQSFELSTQSAIRLTDDDAEERSFVFDPSHTGTSLFAFVKDEPNGEGVKVPKVYLGSIAGPQIKRLTPATEADANPVFQPIVGESFLLTAARYTDRNASPSSYMRIVKWGFASFDGAQGNNVTDYIDASVVRVMDERVPAAAALDFYSFARRVTELGSVLTDTTNIAAKSVAMLYSTGSITEVPVTKSPFEILSLSMSRGGQRILVVGKQAFKCGEETSYGASMIMRESNLNTYLMPLTGTASGSWELKADPCSKSRADKSDGAQDRKIIDAQIAANNNSGGYTIVYSTGYSKDFEVRWMVVSASGEAVFSDVSANRSPE